MLTFQNQSLRDKAKRFEEALRRSTDEQIVVSKYPAYIYIQRAQTETWHTSETLGAFYSNTPFHTFIFKCAYFLAGCFSAISTHRARPQEFEGGRGNEEPADTPAGEEDL